MIAVLIYLIFVAVVFKMASDRKRNVLFWTVLSLIISPLVTMIVLFAIGDNQ